MVLQVAEGSGVGMKVRRRRPEICATRRLSVRRAIAAGVVRKTSAAAASRNGARKLAEVAREGAITADIGRVFVTSRMYVHFVYVHSYQCPQSCKYKISSGWVVLFERAA